MSDKTPDDIAGPLPPHFTSDQLDALRQAREVVKQGVLADHLARRARVKDDSKMAEALDKRIAQIRAAGIAADAGAQPSAAGDYSIQGIAEGAMLQYPAIFSREAKDAVEV